jgi:hypothetical protein
MREATVSAVVHRKAREALAKIWYFRDILRTLFRGGSFYPSSVHARKDCPVFFMYFHNIMQHVGGMRGTLGQRRRFVELLKESPRVVPGAKSRKRS